jgi:hypothetical protein
MWIHISKVPAGSLVIRAVVRDHMDDMLWPNLLNHLYNLLEK